jgi:hypothetical protein
MCEVVERRVAGVSRRWPWEVARLSQAGARQVGRGVTRGTSTTQSSRGWATVGLPEHLSLRAGEALRVGQPGCCWLCADSVRNGSLH